MTFHHLPFRAAAFAIALSPFALPDLAGAAPRLTMSEAVERCTARTKRYASDGVGRSGRERSAFEIRSIYKRCIFGYTGQNARSIPDFSRH